MTLLSIWNKTYYHNSLKDWGISLLFILGGIIVAKLLFYLSRTVFKKLAEKTKSKLDDLLIDKLEEPIVLSLVLTSIWIAVARLHFTDSADEFLGNSFHLLIAINVTWLIARVVDALIVEYIVPIVEKTESQMDDQIMPIIRKGIKGIIWTLGIIVGLNNAGYDVGALIAGIGIGGLALALAAKDTVSNIFGGIMIFLDKPFKLGERIQVSGIDGIVEEVGIRSTRVRTLTGRLVTIPNKTFSDSNIENVTEEPSRKIVLNLGMTYDTTPEKMELAMQILADLCKENQDKIEEKKSIGFNAFGDFNLGILFIYYIKPEADILDTQTLFNLEILKRYNAEGLEFAFPTQTVFKKELN